MLSKGLTDNINKVQDSMDLNLNNLEYIDSVNRDIGEDIGSMSNNTDNLSSVIDKISQNANNNRAVSDQLNSSIDEISVVISLIRDISDQTNLLALNAAIASC